MRIALVASKLQEDYKFQKRRWQSQTHAVTYPSNLNTVAIATSNQVFVAMEIQAVLLQVFQDYHSPSFRVAHT